VGQVVPDIGREIKGAFTGGIATQTFNLAEYKKPPTIAEVAASYVGQRPPYKDWLQDYALTHPLEAEQVRGYERPENVKFVANVLKSTEAKGGVPQYDLAVSWHQEAQKEYEEKYGKGTYAQAKGIEAASFFFQPARVMEPTVTRKDIGAGEWVIGGAQVALLASPFIAKGVSASWARFGKVGTNLTKLEQSAQALGAAERELAAVSKLRTGGVLETPAIAARAQAATQATRIARSQFAEAFNNLKGISSNELIRIERLSGVKGLKGEFNVLSRNYATLDNALARLEGQKVGTVGYSKALNEVAVARQSYLSSYNSLTEKLQPTLLKTTRTFVAEKPSLTEVLFGKTTGEYGLPYQTKAGTRFAGKQVGLWEEQLPLFEFKGLRPITKITGVKVETFPEAPPAGGRGFTIQKLKAIDPATGKTIEKEILVPGKPKVAVATKPKVEIVTETKFKPLYEPRTGEGYDPLWREKVYGKPDPRVATATEELYITWRKTPGGLLMPVFSTLVAEREWIQPTPATIAPVVTTTMEPASFPNIIGFPSLAPVVSIAPAVVPAQKVGVVPAEAVAPSSVSAPTPAPSSVSTPVVTKLWVPTPVPPPVPYEPPVWKISPPIIVPPLLPKFPGLFGGRGAVRHGLKSVYVSYTQPIPGMYIALPTFRTLKPPSLGKKTWDKLIREPQGLEFLSEESEEPVATPWGKKYVRTVAARAKLKAGAAVKGAGTLGITSAEDFFAPQLKRKTAIKKSTGKAYNAYEISGDDVGVQKWVG